MEKKEKFPNFPIHQHRSNCIMRCFTQQEIEKQTGIAKSTAENRVKRMSEKGNFSEFGQAPESLKTFNLWNFAMINR